ncbi:MAG: DUF4344 domain-containing metallopeptidase [Xanthomonadales bacterium]|nr:DUF4344 domain-containing metallopeptidase [Xanthomonadales bacterium]
MKPILALSVASLLLFAMDAHAAPEANRIEISYEVPENPAHSKIYEDLKENKVLERLQEFLSPFRLVIPVEIIMAGCDGEPEAEYGDGEILICYEFVEMLIENMPDETTPAGIEPADTVVGPFFDTVLHEFSHALFDMFYTPMFGREEDAADQLAAYLYLQLGEDEARRLIRGTVYNYLVVETNDEDSAQTAEEFIEDSAETHSFPSQRAYNLLCMAYGANPKLFADLVSKWRLPEDRVEFCVEEYEQVQQAYRDLIKPHTDPALAKEVFDKSWLRKVERGRWK